MFEHKSRRPLTRTQFAWRMARVIGFAFTVMLVALFIGMLGYRYLQPMGWVDAFLNASMILTGMGPVQAEEWNSATKIFGSIYALFSGLLFISMMGIVLAPVAHRVLHKFNVDEQDVER